ncbi:hypothetical protein SDC9_71952 [bioreactor metagenome]|uniref:Uncharacterized protein n=1 Tax=bioreactor metagenome TaxID=1076179 RepID=A0A644YBY1_9ZZZZ
MAIFSKLSPVSFLVLGILLISILVFLLYQTRNVKPNPARRILIFPIIGYLYVGLLRFLEEKQYLSDTADLITTLALWVFIVAWLIVSIHDANKYAKSEKAKAYLKTANISLVIAAIGVVVVIVLYVLSKAGF